MTSNLSQSEALPWIYHKHPRDQVHRRQIGTWCQATAVADGADPLLLLLLQLLLPMQHRGWEGEAPFVNLFRDVLGPLARVEGQVPD